MCCIIDQCYACQSPTDFTTYTFPYVMPSPTIGLVYDLLNLFPFSYFTSFLFLFFISFFYLQHESKEAKTQTKFYYITLTRLHR